MLNTLYSIIIILRSDFIKAILFIESSSYFIVGNHIQVDIINLHFLSSPFFIIFIIIIKKLYTFKVI